MAAESNSISTTTPASRRKPWRAALFFIGSAALGGMAVALWGRKELSRMRDQERTAPPEPPHSDEEAF